MYPRTQAFSPQHLSLAVLTLVLQATNAGVRRPGRLDVSTASTVKNAGVRRPGYEASNNVRVEHLLGHLGMSPHGIGARLEQV